MNQRMKKRFYFHQKYFNFKNHKKVEIEKLI